MSSDGSLKVSANALDVDARAADFLIQRRNGSEWREGDQAALDAWLSESLAHRTAYWRLESVWARADRLNALRPMNLPGGPVGSPQRSRRPFLLAAVAIAAIAAIGVSASYLTFEPTSVTYATPVGGRETIRLADGSQIDLNTDTVLRASFQHGQRSAELVRGEALFQIKHDAARPFVVRASGHRLTDLGTKFLVREDGDHLKVALLEGSVHLAAIDQGEGHKSVTLTPGDEAIATMDDLSVSRKSPKQLESETGWQRGVLTFHRATLVEVAKEFNRYNERKIVIGDAATGSRIINGTLPTNDVHAFARMARTILGLHVQESTNEVVISH